MLDALEEFFNFDGTEVVVSKKEYGNYIYSRFALVNKKVVKTRFNRVNKILLYFIVILC